MGYVELLNESARKQRKQELLERYKIAEDSIIEAQKPEPENRLHRRTTKSLNETAVLLENTRAEKENAARYFTESNNNLMTSLITECFMSIFNKSIDYSEDQYDPNVAKSFIYNYIKNESNTTILSRMKSSSIVLSEMAFLVEGVYESCKTKKCEDEEEDSIKHDEIVEKKYKIEPETKDKFFEDLDNIIDLDDVTQSIQLRVSNAMSEFINHNSDKKRQIDDTIENIKEKINADTSEDVKEAYKMDANRRIDAINNSGYNNLFEKLVTNLSESTYRNDALKRLFCENGKINMDKVIQHVKSLYSVLEIFNTTGLEKFTPEKIENIVEEYTMR